MAQVTRLSLMGVAMRPYGSFAGKAAAVTSSASDYSIPLALLFDGLGHEIDFDALKHRIHFSDPQREVN